MDRTTSYKKLNANFLNSVLLASILCAVSVQSMAQKNRLDSRMINKRITQILDSAGIPGLSIAIIDHGKTKFYKTYGVKNIETKEQVDKRTIFEAASLTKPVVAYCALKLAEENKLDLDRPLYKYLAYNAVAHDDRYKSITARMVLSHTTGFPNWRSNRSGDTLNIRFQPGARFSYSGEGFVFLQKVIEHISDKDLSAIAKTYVFDPLKMDRSYLVFGDDQNYAIGHDKDRAPKSKTKPDLPNAAYSLHTTAFDYARFLNELFNPEFIGKDMINQMTTSQVRMSEVDASLAWGLGIGLNIIEDDTLAWHWGDNGVFKSYSIVSIRSGRGFTYFANSQNGLSFVHRLIDLVFTDERVMNTWNIYNQF